MAKAVNSNQNNSKNATYMNPLGKSQARNVNGYYEGGSSSIQDKAKDIANQVKAKNGAAP